jgi:putative transcriptional regulator
MITSKEIKELREKLGATQGEFAKSLGVSFSTISRWESGQSQPTDMQEEQLVALKQLIENKEIDIDKKKLRKMLGLIGISGVITTAVIAGFTISSPWGAAVTSLIKKSSNAGKIRDLFKKNKKRDKSTE